MAELKTLSEILKQFDMSKVAYWQLKYRGAELPEAEGERPKTGGGRPEKLYDPDKVAAAIADFKNRRLRLTQKKLSVIEKVVEAIKQPPQKTRKELEQFLGAVTEDQKGAINKALNTLEDRGELERIRVVGEPDKLGIKAP